MKKKHLFIIMFLAFFSSTLLSAKTTSIAPDVLKDKIKGGWAGQTIGCTFGAPTEFEYRGTMIQPYIPIPWYDGYLKYWYTEGKPSLYDDIYMDLTFVDVIDKLGVNAPADSFAQAFAHAGYLLAHANQMARYNILNGIKPPESGHWLNNPHADDIDFQIEADFAGLMCPGMIQSAAEICDRVGHIMNYGDGWYGGVFIAGLYSLAFISDDLDYIICESLKQIPTQSRFYQCISDVIRWHKQYPNDWRQCWFEIEKKWTEDIACPQGVFLPFNIDATVNSAYTVLGLLYGNGDFGKTLSISTRCGQDSDCNPASAGGVLGTIIGYNNIPAFWKLGLAEVEDMNFNFTRISLNKVYELSYKHALQMVNLNQGKVEVNNIFIPVQNSVQVKFEQSFPGLFPVERKNINLHSAEQITFSFEGIGFVLLGGAVNPAGIQDTLLVSMSIDNKYINTTVRPTEVRTKNYVPFWNYQLTPGKHTVVLTITNPSPGTELQVTDLLIFNNKPKNNIY